MTIPLQIGDIVRINAPTPEEKSILAELYDAITDDDTGRLAVVIDIKHQSNPLVSVVPCDENFELTVEGIPTTFVHYLRGIPATVGRFPNPICRNHHKHWVHSVQRT